MDNIQLSLTQLYSQLKKLCPNIRPSIFPTGHLEDIKALDEQIHLQGLQRSSNSGDYDSAYRVYVTDFDYTAGRVIIQEVKVLQENVIDF